VRCAGDRGGDAAWREGPCGGRLGGGHGGTPAGTGTLGVADRPSVIGFRLQTIMGRGQC
jgi:hypothetical protein